VGDIMSYLNWTSLFVPLCWILGGKEGMYALSISLGLALVIEFVFRITAEMVKEFKDVLK